MLFASIKSSVFIIVQKLLLTPIVKQCDTKASVKFIALFKANAKIAYAISFAPLQPLRSVIIAIIYK